ncbi:MAG TPA: roadblock/LC7 domain-containing protein [Blastocatellia bacterium]
MELNEFEGRHTGSLPCQDIFAKVLRELVRAVDGARGAIFLDGEGEAVQWYSVSDSERLRLRAAYLAVVVQSYRASSAKLSLGKALSLVVQYQAAQFVIEEIDGGYFLVLELGPSANLAQCAGRLAPAVATLRREI